MKYKILLLIIFSFFISSTALAASSIAIPNKSSSLIKITRDNSNLRANPYIAMEGARGIPKIDGISLSDVSNNKLQIFMFYWARDVMSYEKIEYRITGTSTIFTTFTNPIPGFGYWLVFQDLTNLSPNTSYDIRVIGTNSYGTYTSPWHTYSTL